MGWKKDTVKKKYVTKGGGRERESERERRERETRSSTFQYPVRRRNGVKKGYCKEKVCHKGWRQRERESERERERLGLPLFNIQ